MLQVPAAALSLESLQVAGSSTSALAISSASSAAAPSGRRLEQTSSVAAASGSPVTLVATLSLDPQVAAESGSPFTAAWTQAALEQAAADQPTDGAEVQLAGVDGVGRAGVCGNGICEVSERAVQGLVNGTCPQDCTVPTKVSRGGGGAGSFRPSEREGLTKGWQSDGSRLPNPRRPLCRAAPAPAAPGLASPPAAPASATPPTPAPPARTALPGISR